MAEDNHETFHLLSFRPFTHHMCRSLTLLNIFFRPLWLSPRQVMVVPVGPTCEEYAQRVSPAHTLIQHICSSRHVSDFSVRALLAKKTTCQL